jgi:DNA-binding response OmpR family regulator
LIILDLLMPEIDGWQALELLISNPSSKSIPVIISSVLSEDEDFENARSMGAVDYLPNPWNSRDLLSRIRWAATTKKSVASTPGLSAVFATAESILHDELPVVCHAKTRPARNSDVAFGID